MFIVTFVLTFVVVAVALLFFLLKGSPVYRVERANVISLLELVVSGQASDNDWQVFIGHPIRHDPELGDIQRRCMDIGEREYLGTPGKLFTRRGVEELAKILAELKEE